MKQQKLTLELIVDKASMDKPFAEALLGVMEQANAANTAAIVCMSKVQNMFLIGPRGLGETTKNVVFFKIGKKVTRLVIDPFLIRRTLNLELGA